MSEPAHRLTKIERKLIVLQAALADLVEEWVELKALLAKPPEEEPVAEKRVGRKLKKGEKVEVK